MPNFALQAGRTATTVRQDATLVTSTGIYASGDVIGAAFQMKMASRFLGGGGMVRSVFLTDLDDQKSAVDVMLFSGMPTSSDVADNAKYDLADTDLPLYLGHISVASSDYATLSDNAVGILACELPYVAAYESGDIYGLIIARGTPTYTTHASLAVGLILQQD